MWGTHSNLLPCNYYVDIIKEVDRCIGTDWDSTVLPCRWMLIWAVIWLKQVDWNLQFCHIDDIIACVAAVAMRSSYSVEPKTEHSLHVHCRRRSCLCVTSSVFCFFFVDITKTWRHAWLHVWPLQPVHRRLVIRRHSGRLPGRVTCVIGVLEGWNFLCIVTPLWGADHQNFKKKFDEKNFFLSY